MAHYWHWDDTHLQLRVLVLGPFCQVDLEIVDNMLAGVFLFQPRSIQRRMLDGLPVLVRALVYARGTLMGWDPGPRALGPIGPRAHK